MDLSGSPWSSQFLMYMFWSFVIIDGSILACHAYLINWGLSHHHQIYFLSLVIFFVLKSTLFDINVIIPAVSWSVSVCCLFVRIYTFNLPVSLHLKFVSDKQLGLGFLPNLVISSFKLGCVSQGVVNYTSWTTCYFCKWSFIGMQLQLLI